MDALIAVAPKALTAALSATGSRDMVS